MLWDGVHGLVRRAQAGDATAWQPLFALVQPFLVGTAARLVGSGGPGNTSVSDVAQETWLRAWKAIGSFAGGTDDATTGAMLRAWLAQTMKNVWRNDVRAATARRRQAPAALVPVAGPADDPAGGAVVPGRDPTPSAGVCDAERERLIRAALEHLADVLDREIVRRYFFEGTSLTRIAAALGVSLDRARLGFHRGLKTLRPHLDGLQ